MSQSVGRLTLARVMISQYVSLSPMSGSVLTAWNLEPALNSVSPSLSAPPPLILSLCLCLKNKYYKNSKKWIQGSTKNSHISSTWIKQVLLLGLLQEKLTPPFFHLYFLRDRERQSMSGGGAERVGDTESQAGSRLWTVSTEPDMGLKLTDHKIMAWAKVGSSADWATQVPQNWPIF